MAWTPVLRSSTCADGLMVNAETGQAALLYSDGKLYRYEQVDTTAIHDLLNDKDLSVGDWVNTHLKRGGVPCRLLTTL